MRLRTLNPRRRCCRPTHALGLWLLANARSGLFLGAALRRCLRLHRCLRLRRCLRLCRCLRLRARRVLLTRCVAPTRWQGHTSRGGGGGAAVRLGQLGVGWTSATRQLSKHQQPHGHPCWTWSTLSIPSYTTPCKVRVKSKNPAGLPRPSSQTPNQAAALHDVGRASTGPLFYFFPLPLLRPSSCWARHALPNQRMAGTLGAGLRMRP